MKGFAALEVSRDAKRSADGISREDVRPNAMRSNPLPLRLRYHPDLKFRGSTS